jgi:hypothetical protein
VLHEPITAGLLIGFPLVIVGSVLGTWGREAPAPDATGAVVECEDVLVDDERPHR